jgi:predicted RNA-binding protein (virulence factor B family)
MLPLTNPSSAAITSSGTEREETIKDPSFNSFHVVQHRNSLGAVGQTGLKHSLLILVHSSIIAIGCKRDAIH